jgi:hypothetical protein
MFALQTYIDCPTTAELDAQATFNLVAGGGKSNAGPPRRKACNPNGVSIRTIQLAGRASAIRRLFLGLVVVDLKFLNICRHSVTSDR